MPRIIGVDIPPKKQLVIALTYIFGIGLKKSSDLVKKLNYRPDMLAKDLSEDQISAISAELQKDEVEGALRRRVKQDIERLLHIQCYRGIRHKQKLPVRGQRTSTNARTRKGPKGLKIKRKK